MHFQSKHTFVEGTNSDLGQPFRARQNHLTKITNLLSLTGNPDSLGVCPSEYKYEHNYTSS